MIHEETVRFIDPCNRCGQVLREFKEKVITHEHIKLWVPEYHEMSDCIRYLNERIERLENRT
jgi:cytidine deaminase